MIDKLKTFTAERLALEELIELDAYAAMLVSGFERNSLGVPEWLAEKSKQLHATIVSKQRDAWAKELAEKRRELESLKSVEDKRKERTERIAELEAKLK